MTQEDPSDWFLKENLKLINETPERYYYVDEPNKILVGSWKFGSAEHYDARIFQQNALLFAQLIEEVKPKHVVVDCRYLGFEISDQDHRWYINQTRSLWARNEVKKMAFIFKSNLAVQMSMEGLIDVAEEEGVKSYEHRIFENITDAFSWVRT